MSPGSDLDRRNQMPNPGRPHQSSSAHSVLSAADSKSAQSQSAWARSRRTMPALLNGEGSFSFGGSFSWRRRGARIAGALAVSIGAERCRLELTKQHLWKHSYQTHSSCSRVSSLAPSTSRRYGTLSMGRHCHDLGDCFACASMVLDGNL